MIALPIQWIRTSQRHRRCLRGSALPGVSPLGRLLILPAKPHPLLLRRKQMLGGHPQRIGMRRQQKRQGSQLRHTEGLVPGPLAPPPRTVPPPARGVDFELGRGPRVHRHGQIEPPLRDLHHQVTTGAFDQFQLDQRVLCAHARATVRLPPARCWWENRSPPGPTGPRFPAGSRRGHRRTGAG